MAGSAWDFLFGGSPTANLTKTTVDTTATPAWYQDATRGIVAKADAIAAQPYQAYTGPRVAGMTPDTQNSFDMVRNNVNNWQPSFNQAGQNLTAAGSTDISGSAAPYMNTASQTFTGNNVDNYMSPYTDNVVNEIARLGNQNFNENIMPGLNDTFVKSGQFGSGRNAEVVSRAARDTQQNITGQQAAALEGGYKTASDIFASDTGRNAILADTAGKLSEADAANYRSTAEQQRLLGGDTSRLGAADAAMLSDVGTAQQNQNQKNLDTAYTDFTAQRDYNRNNVEWMNNILRGLNTGTQQTTTGGTNQTGAPFASVLGNAAALYGAGNKAKGGMVKGDSIFDHLAEGGMPEQGGMMADLSELLTPLAGPQSRDPYILAQAAATGDNYGDNTFLGTYGRAAKNRLGVQQNEAKLDNEIAQKMIELQKSYMGKSAWRPVNDQDRQQFGLPADVAFQIDDRTGEVKGVQNSTYGLPTGVVPIDAAAGIYGVPLKGGGVEIVNGPDGIRNAGRAGSNPTPPPASAFDELLVDLPVTDVTDQFKSMPAVPAEQLNVPVDVPPKSAMTTSSSEMSPAASWEDKVLELSNPNSYLTTDPKDFQTKLGSATPEQRQWAQKNAEKSQTDWATFDENELEESRLSPLMLQWGGDIQEALQDPNSGFKTGPLSGTKTRIKSALQYELSNGLAPDNPRRAKTERLMNAIDAADAYTNALVRQNRSKGEGSMSNFDALMLKLISPSLDKSGAFNEQFIGFATAQAKRDRDYKRFMSFAKQKEIPYSKARDMWKQYSNDNPLFSPTAVPGLEKSEYGSVPQLGEKGRQKLEQTLGANKTLLNPNIMKFEDYFAGMANGR